MSLENKEVFMNGSDYIELESIGVAVYNNGMTYGINEDGTHDTDSSWGGVHIKDCSTEWWSYMSMADALLLFPFLAETDLYHEEGYMSWAVQMFEIVEENCNDSDVMLGVAQMSGKCDKCGKIPPTIDYKDKKYCTWYCAKKG